MECNNKYILKKSNKSVKLVRQLLSHVDNEIKSNIYENIILSKL